jgi:DNA helicase-2/ATP-dependent DNA helicase PcrA
MSEGARQHRKTLLGTRQSPQKPFYVALDDAQAQAEYITGKILQTREIGGSLKRHAILFRSSHHSDVLEVELTKKNIPFVKYGGLKFLEAAHVKDMMSVLRWADNPQNAVAGFRVLKLQPGFGPANAKQALEHFEARGFEAKSLADFDAPQPVKMEWKRFCALFEKLADPATPWPGQVGLVKDWYKPQLERIYDSGWTRMGDIEQLDQLSVQHLNRERFLTELTLDPPLATSDQSAGASKDEDYVILSTIHSAKGQEWDNVYILNVSDGNFPSEFSTGKPEMIEEERRLLYVAMTRARNELHLCAPLKFAVTQQAKNGDAHVYGAKSRFMTDKLLDSFEKITVRTTVGVENLKAGDTATVDVVAQLKEMW